MSKNKKMMIKSTQSFCSVRDVRNGVIATKDGRYVLLTEFTPVNFDLKSESEKRIIISQFAAALKTMPPSVQIKVITRHTDATRYIERITNDMQKESDERCRELMADQISLIKRISQQHSVSRRFIVAITYDAPVKIQRKPSFNEICESLYRDAGEIATALEACGCACISPKYDDDYVCELLYEIMCRNEANTNSYVNKKNAILASMASRGNIDFSKSPYLSVADVISPSLIDTTAPNYIKVDDLYYMFCYLPSSAYPCKAVGGWAALLVNIGEGVDVDFYFQKEKIETIQRKLQYKLSYNKVKIRHADDTAQDYDELESAIESGYYLKNGIANGEDLYYVASLITITANSERELKEKYNEIRNHCIRNSIKIKPCIFQQLDAYNMALPLGQIDKNIWKKAKRNALTSGVASFFPFLSFEICDKNGILLGLNRNGTSVFVDIFDTKVYSNANVAILGTSGAGKTYTLELMALRMRQQGTQVFIIAPLKGVEFEKACKAVGGSFVKIAPGSPDTINVMEIRKKSDDIIAKGTTDTSILAKKIQQMHTFFSLILNDITFEEKQVLDEALIKTYGNFGITSRNKSLLDPSDPSKYKTMPTLGDLHKTLEKSLDNGSKRLYHALARYISGSAKSFNRQTNVNLDNKFIVLDVSELTDEMLPVGMFVALDYVWDKAKEDRAKNKAIFVDEAWRLIGASSTALAAKFLLEIFKIIRGYGGSAIAATQDINDFFALDNGAYGKGIVNNARTKMVLRAEKVEIPTLIDKLDLTQREADSVMSFNRGTVLLMSNSNHVFIDILASKKEHELITTSASDLAKDGAAS